MTVRKNSIFADYYDAAKKRVTGLTKTRAIELSEQQLQRLISQESIQQLYESLTCVGWKYRKDKKGANWVWRTEVGKPANKNPYKEVRLERAVADQDLEQWTYQMSTSSGVQTVHGKMRQVNLNSRRAIDLVRFIGPRHYAFVELKVDSDNPLYAAFEILGYALAYLHAKADGWIGTGRHDVFDAERIELIILGPKNWYRYDKRGTDMKFKLDWLADEIAKSLNDFVKTEFKGEPAFSMKFRKLSKGSHDEQVTEIHYLAESW